MITIANDFNKELDRYIDSRQSSKPTDFLIRKKKQDKRVEEKVPEMDGTSVIVEDRDMSFFEKIFKKRKEEEFPEVEEAIDTEIEKTEDIQQLEEEYEELDEAEQAIEERKESIFSRIMNKIRHATIEEEQVETFDDDGNIVYDEDTFIIPDDLKEALRIQNVWLGKLSHAQMNAFKVSEDYKRYQNILRKYGLIK